MAELAPVKLEAVNRILRSCGEKVVAALDTGGASPEADVERILDQVTERILAEGHEENVEVCKTLTATAGAIAVPSDTLYVSGAGSSQHRHFACQGTILWDVDAWTATFGTSEVVQVRLVHLLTYATCTPRLKIKIIAEAELQAQRYLRGSQQKDMEFQQTFERTQGLPTQPTTRPGQMPVNNTPPFRMMGDRPQQG